MPNWACNHLVASGNQKQLRALAETLNTMPNLKNGFGRYWMGNLAAALMGVTEEDLEDLILEKFPGIILAWSCTDEFGNFHITHNPEKLPDLDVIAFNGLQYSRNDVLELKRDLRENCPGLRFNEDADMDYFLSDAFINLYSKWSDNFIDENKDVWAPWFEIYAEV